MIQLFGVSGWEEENELKMTNVITPQAIPRVFHRVASCPAALKMYCAKTEVVASAGGMWEWE